MGILPNRMLAPGGSSKGLSRALLRWIGVMVQKTSSLSVAPVVYRFYETGSAGIPDYAPHAHAHFVPWGNLVLGRSIAGCFKN